MLSWLPLRTDGRLDVAPQSKQPAAAHDADADTRSRRRLPAPMDYRAALRLGGPTNLIQRPDPEEGQTVVAGAHAVFIANFTSRLKAGCCSILLRSVEWIAVLSPRTGAGRLHQRRPQQCLVGRADRASQPLMI